MSPWCARIIEIVRGGAFGIELIAEAQHAIDSAEREILAQPKGVIDAVAGGIEWLAKEVTAAKRVVRLRRRIRTLRVGNPGG